MKAKDIFVFVGPPGSGKGTLSQYCVKNLGWHQLSTGDLCRKHIKEKTDIGKRIDFAIKSGKLIDDQLIVQMVEEWLKKHLAAIKAVILDGFPRTAPQAEALQQLLQKEFSDCRLHVVVFDIPDEIVIERLSSRAICSNLICQAVYSLLNSSLTPQKEGVCDSCKSPLIQRPDDRPEAIRERLKVYHVHEQQLIQFYHDLGLDIIHLDAHKPLDQVYEEFISNVFLEK